MRRRTIALSLSGLVVALLIVVRATPLRLYIIKPKLTATQQTILDQADAGLRIYATRSQTARSLYRDARVLTRRAVFVPGAGAFPLQPGTNAPVTVAVTPIDHNSLIASYNCQDDIVLFVESTSRDMSHLTLGLVYGHELQHRRDFRDGIYRAGDTLRSAPRWTTELRARQAGLRMLSEFTAGRWDSAVTHHMAICRSQSTTWQRQRPHGKARFMDDENWLRQEFGRLPEADLGYLLQQLQFDAALRLGLPDTTVSSADTLRSNLRTITAY